MTTASNPICFSNVEETGIPPLRRYCHILTARSHRKAALRNLKVVKALANSVRTSISIVSEEAERDQEEVRHTWESRLMRNILPGENTILASNAASSGIAARLRMVGFNPTHSFVLVHLYYHRSFRL